MPKTANPTPCPRRVIAIPVATHKRLLLSLSAEIGRRGERVSTYAWADKLLNDAMDRIEQKK